MDGVGIAASIISIATAGIQISIKLVTLSTQISSASERVSSIGNDVSLTSGVLYQLGELMTQKSTGNGISIFSEGGLESTRTSAAMCERIFKEIEKEFGRASEQLRSCRKFSGGKIKLSKSEKLKWPFLQPSIDILRADLREAKGTLMLMLQVTTLALSKKMADLSATASLEQGDIFRAIVALQQQQERKHQETVSTKKRLSGGSIGSASTQVKQDSGLVASCIIASGGSQGFSLSSTPKAVHSPSAAPRALVVEGSTSSSVHLARSESSLDCSSTNTPLTTIDSGSTNGGKEAQAYQIQLTLLEQQNKKHLILEQQNKQQSGSSTIPTEPKVPGEIGAELRMFMLKPIVKDFFDRIELSWSIQNPKMHASSIRYHLARMEADGLPSVMDMLETLHDYEHSMINAHQGQGELLSLKRTKTDIQHRDIVFKDIPGLQFVVEPRKYPKYGAGVIDSFERKQSMGAVASLTPVSSDEASKKSSDNKIGGKMDLASFLQDSTLGSWADEMKIAPAKSYSLSQSAHNDDSSRSRARNATRRPRTGTRRLKIGPFPQVPPTAFQKSVTEKRREAKVEGVFAGLNGCVLVKGGMVEDEEGKTVGQIVEGNTERLTGCAVNENGEIIDKSGKVKGHAEPNEEPEKELSNVPAPENSNFSENARKFSVSASFDPSVFKEVKQVAASDEEHDLQEQRLQNMETEMEGVFMAQLAEKGRKYKQHEEELRTRQLELQRLERQRVELEMKSLELLLPQASLEFTPRSSNHRCSEDDGQAVVEYPDPYSNAAPQEHPQSVSTHTPLRGVDSPTTPRISAPISIRSSHTIVLEDHMSDDDQAMPFANHSDEPRILDNFDFKERNIASLFKRNKFLQVEVEQLEKKIMVAKQAVDESVAHRKLNKSLQSRLKLLEEEANESAAIIRETDEKYTACLVTFERTYMDRADWSLHYRLRHINVKASHYQHEMPTLLSACDASNTKYKDIVMKYAQVKKELEDLHLGNGKIDRVEIGREQGFQGEWVSTDIADDGYPHQALESRIVSNEKPLSQLNLLERSSNASPSADASGTSSEAPSVEIFKSFRVSMDESTDKVLPAAFKKYGIKGDIAEYALYIVCGDQERCLGKQEKPLLLFKQLDREGRNPRFMLRRHAMPLEGYQGTILADVGPERKMETSLKGSLDRQILQHTSTAQITHQPDASENRVDSRKVTQISQSVEPSGRTPRIIKKLESSAEESVGSGPGELDEKFPQLQKLPYIHDGSFHQQTRGETPQPVIHGRGTVRTGQEATFGTRDSQYEWDRPDKRSSKVVPDLRLPVAGVAPEEIKARQGYAYSLLDVMGPQGEKFEDLRNDEFRARGPSRRFERDSVDENFCEEEYSDDDDDDGEGPTEREDTYGADLEAEKRIVEGLLQQYTTLYI